VEVLSPGELPSDFEQWPESRRVLFLQYVGTADWRLRYEGPGGGNGGGDRISEEHAGVLIAVLSAPISFERIAELDFYDNAGICTACAAPYCSVHWGDSSSGYGRCPNGHGASLDPHWSPDFDEPGDLAEPASIGADTPDAAMAREHARAAFLRPLDSVLQVFLTLVDHSSAFSRIRQNVLFEKHQGSLRSWDIEGSGRAAFVDGDIVVCVDDYIFGYLDHTEYVMPFDDFVQLFWKYEAICRPDDDR